MKRGFFSGFAKVLIFCAIVTVGAFAWLVLRNAQYQVDRRELEWLALSRSLNSVDNARVPDVWASALYLSNRSINKLLALADGTTVRFDQESQANDTVLTVKAIRLRESQPGFPTGSIDLEASSNSRNLDVGLRGEGALIFSGIETGKSGKKVARFSVQPLRLEPTVKWYSLRFGARGYASELLAAGTAVLFTKSLRFDVPIPDEISVTPDQKPAMQIPVRDPPSENWIHLTGIVNAGTIRDGVTFDHPVFTDGGMWLGARRRAKGQASWEQIARGSKTDVQLDEEIANLRAKIRKFGGPSGGAGDVAVWINGVGISSLVQKISELPSETKTATFKSDKFEGRIADKEWRDNILGKGGVFVEFNKPDAVKATLSVGNVSGKWLPHQGLALTVTAHLTATADVHVHVDPLIGGGVGTNVGLEGAADAPLKGLMQVSKIAVGSGTALILAPKMQCELTKLELKTDGKLVVSWGWTKVPPIGAKVETSALNNLVWPLILLSDSPNVLQGRTGSNRPLSVNAGGKLLQIAPAWRSANIAFRPLEATAGDVGLLLSVALDVTSSPMFAGNAAAERETEAKLKQDVSEQVKAFECPSDYSVAVLIGDVEIGPNNEIVKFLKNAWNDITKGPGKNNEVVKAVKAASDALTAAGKPLDDATKGMLNEINSRAAKTFGENSEAAKAINLATAIGRPPTVGKNGDGGVTVSLPGGTVSTGGGHGGVGVTVETPLGRWKF